MSPPPSDRYPPRKSFELDSDPPPSDGDEPATRKELRKVVKHFGQQVADLHEGFAAHRARVSADITGSVRAAVVEQIEPHAEKLEKLERQNDALEEQSKQMYRILLKQEARAETKAEETREKEAIRKNRIALLAGLSPIILALIAAWSAWVARQTPPPQQPTQHIEAK